MTVASRFRRGAAGSAAEPQSEAAYRRIRGRIVSVELPPGSVLDERELRRWLGLGRTPVREALRKLAGERLVTVVPRRGTFVANVGPTDAQEIFEVRAELEAFCARLAAERAEPDQLVALEATVSELDRAVVKGDGRRALELDQRFHAQLAEAARNEVLLECLEGLYQHALRVWNVAFGARGGLPSAASDHRAILTAVARGDAAAAERAMRDHVAASARALKEAMGG